MNILHIETLTSSPIPVPNGEISLRSKYIQLRFPIANGGLIWNRPVAIVVRTVNGQEKTVPILDVTRITVIALAGLCFISTFALLFLRRKMPKS